MYHGRGVRPGSRDGKKRCSVRLEQRSQKKIHKISNVLASLRYFQIFEILLKTCQLTLFHCLFPANPPSHGPSLAIPLVNGLSLAIPLFHGLSLAISSSMLQAQAHIHSPKGASSRGWGTGGGEGGRECIRTKYLQTLKV